VWHPYNDVEFGHYLVIDGNHRVTALQDLSQEEGGNQEKFKYIKAVVLHPQTDLSTLEKLGKGKQD